MRYHGRAQVIDRAPHQRLGYEPVDPLIGRHTQRHRTAPAAAPHTAATIDGWRPDVKEFVFQRGTTIWPEGETLWHVYATARLDHDTALASLVAGCRSALDGFPLTMVDDQWLHITIVIKRFWQDFLVKLVGAASGTFGTTPRAYAVPSLGHVLAERLGARGTEHRRPLRDPNATGD